MKSVVYVWAYYTNSLYCVCVITSSCTRAATEEDTVWEQQVEADAVGEQFGLTTRD